MNASLGQDTNQQFFGSLWNENTIKYLSRSAGGRWFNDLLLMLLEKIDPDSISTVADVGCGVGMKTATMAKYFSNATVSGFDFAASAIEAASKAHQFDNIQFSVEDITKAQNQKRYDLITAFDVLEHIEDWQGLVKSLIAVNNKMMMFSFPTGRMRPYEAKIGHFRNFKRNEVESFMSSSGYGTVETFYAGFPFYSPITRDFTNIFFKNYVEVTQAEMGRASKLFHDIWYLLFRYGSSRKIGDNFIGLFEKISEKQDKAAGQGLDRGPD